MGMADSRTPPLPAVENDVIPLDERRSLHVCGIGRGHAGLRHAERRTNLAGQQGLEPTIFLRRRSILHQHFHVAGVGRVAVKNFGSNRRASHDLRQRRIFHVGEASAVLSIRKEKIPQASGTRPGLQSLHNRRLLPAAPLGDILQLRKILSLGGQDMLLHERQQALDVGLGLR